MQGALASVFDGLTFQRSLSGLDKLQIAEEQGIQFPPALREHMASSPAKYEGDYEAEDFSVEFYAEATELLSELGVVIHGTTTESEPLFALLEERFGWILTHP